MPCSLHARWNWLTMRSRSDGVASIGTRSLSCRFTPQAPTSPSSATASSGGSAGRTTSPNGYICHLIGKSLDDTEIDTRGLHTHVDRVGSRGLDVPRHPGRIWLQGAHRDGALCRQLHAGRLLQSRVEDEAVVAVRRIRGQRLILEILEAAVCDLHVSCDGRRLRGSRDLRVRIEDAGDPAVLERQLFKLREIYAPCRDADGAGCRVLA